MKLYEVAYMFFKIFCLFFISAQLVIFSLYLSQHNLSDCLGCKSLEACSKLATLIGWWLVDCISCLSALDNCLAGKTTATTPPCDSVAMWVITASFTFSIFIVASACSSSLMLTISETVSSVSSWRKHKGKVSFAHTINEPFRSNSPSSWWRWMNQG